jgi:aspartate/methionine/tyrosine aminotransferase
LFVRKLLIRTGLARWLPQHRHLSDGAAAFLHYYSARVLAAPLDELLDDALFPHASGDLLDLANSTPRFDLVPSGSTKLPAERRGYPPPTGTPELRSALASHFLQAYDWQINPNDEVLVTHGATGAFSTALDTFVNPGDGVVLFDPTSPLFSLGLKHRRARLRWVPTWVEEGRTRFHLEPFARAMRHAKMVVLCDPGNPAGGVFAPEDLEQIAWWAERNDVLLYIDESYARFQYDGEPTRVMNFPGAGKRTLVAGGLSKGYGLAAARVGWLAGHRHLIRPAAVTASLTAPFVSVLGQQIAWQALQTTAEMLAPIKAEFANKRQYTHERLTQMGLAHARPAGGFTFWIPVRPLGLTGRQCAEQLLRTHKVVVGAGEPFGPSGASFIRLSYATEEGRLRQGLARLAEFVQEALRSADEGPSPEALPPLPPADRRPVSSFADRSL